MAKHFIYNDKPHINKYIDHIDENKLNNHMNNLRWVTISKNTQYYHDNHKKDFINPVLQYDLDGNLIKEWNNVREILENTEYVVPHIYNAITDKCISAYGYIWKYKYDKIIKETIIEHDEVFKNCGIIEGYDMSNYEVSNYGKIKSLYTGKFLELIIKHGYHRMTFKIKNRKPKVFSVHRLVAYLFVDGWTNEKKYVNHIDKNKLNNYYKNLEWCTHRKNTKHALDKKVQQINIENGNIINTFNSITDAYLSLGFEKKEGMCVGIAKCCKRIQSSAYGYKWKYLDE